MTRNSDNIRWKINGQFDIDFYASSIRQIDSRIILEQNRSHISELTIPAIPINKHIEVIKCEAYKTIGGFEVAESNETAQYHIQGLLEMKPNATYSSYNATHNQIQWLEPFTLNLTNIAHDIENYTVCSHIYLLNTEHALGCINSSDPQIYLPKYSVNLSLLITAWNIVGESNNSVTLDVAACVSNNIQNGKIDNTYYSYTSQYLFTIHVMLFSTGDGFDLKIEFIEAGTTLLCITFKHVRFKTQLTASTMLAYLV